MLIVVAMPRSLRPGQAAGPRSRAPRAENAERPKGLSPLEAYASETRSIALASMAVLPSGSAVGDRPVNGFHFVLVNPLRIVRAAPRVQPHALPTGVKSGVTYLLDFRVDVLA